jgi:peptidoglycan hydrolase-like protein with peptidoglycan-binding domain
MAEGDRPESGTTTGRRRRPILVAAGVGLIGAVAVGSGAWYLAEDTDTAEAAAAPRSTAEVVRGTLRATESWSGTLGHGDPLTVTAAAQGTVTRVADQDEEIELGTELFRVDEEPVVALRGDIPMYRALGIGSSGRDVRQLEDNLSELGYGGFTEDRHYTWATEAAVRAWQDDIGARETGTTGPEQAVFLPEETSVAATHVDVGDAVSPGAPILDLTRGDLVATVEVAPQDRQHLEIDGEVDVELPDGTPTAGTVSSARARPAGEGEDGDQDSVIEVEVVLDEELDPALRGASVDVVADVEERSDVLIVPVNALVVPEQGEYAVEVVEDGATRIVPVETGLFGDGQVEIEGDGIEEGTVVGVAGR